MCLQRSRRSPLRLSDVMLKWYGIFFAVLFALSADSPASAQNPNIMNMFTAIMGAAIVNNARVEWSKIPPNETACIDQELQQQGASIGASIQNGVVPNDPRVAGVRFDCRTATLGPANSPSNQTPAVNNPVPTDISKLSEKPTFDCSHARSLTARTVCFDRAGASADWDLITAYWARYFSLPESERQLFDKAQQDWLDSSEPEMPKDARILQPVFLRLITIALRHIARNWRRCISGISSHAGTARANTTIVDCHWIVER